MPKNASPPARNVKSPCGLCWSKREAVDSAALIAMAATRYGGKAAGWGALSQAAVSSRENRGTSSLVACRTAFARADSQVAFGHRYSSATCPNRRRTCLLLNLPISKSVVRLNATDPAWPNTFQSPCARSIAAEGLGQSMGSPAATPPSMKSKGSATKEVISVMG